MPKASQRAAVLGGSPEDVENAFFEALHNADIDQLMRCWADDDEVICIHPGGARVVGVEAIRAAFGGLLAEGGIQARAEAVRKIHTLAAAVHSIVVCIDINTSDGARTVYVLATNVYAKTPQGWRLVAHHASPATANEVQEVNQPAHVLH